MIRQAVRRCCPAETIRLPINRRAELSHVSVSDLQTSQPLFALAHRSRRPPDGIRLRSIGCRPIQIVIDEAVRLRTEYGEQVHDLGEIESTLACLEF